MIKSGLVEEDRDELDSRVRIYHLRPEAMAELRTWLAETDALWVRQLSALRARTGWSGSAADNYYIPVARSRRATVLFEQP